MAWYFSLLPLCYSDLPIQSAKIVLANANYNDKPLNNFVSSSPDNAPSSPSLPEIQKLDSLVAYHCANTEYPHFDFGSTH